MIRLNSLLVKKIFEINNINLLEIMSYYAVAKGRQIGVFRTWDECKSITVGFKGARFKKFLNEGDAKQFIQMYSGTNIKQTKLTKRKEKDDEEETSECSKQNQMKKFKSEIELPIDSDGYIHVYTDGACENNGKLNAKAGLGVWFGKDHPLNVSEPVKGRATNNCGEIQACTRAIQIVHQQGGKKLCINTDSQFVINSMTQWIQNWKRNNWKLKSGGGDVKNKVDFIELDEACQLLDNIKWNYVRGHKGIEGNEQADLLARNGAQLYTLRKQSK